MDPMPEAGQSLQETIVKTTPTSKHRSPPKFEEQTGIKTKAGTLSQDQHIRIRNQLFAMFTHHALKGKIKVQEFDNLSEVQITLYHKIKNHNVQQNITIIFNCDYPNHPPKLEIHSCNLTALHADYQIPKFMSESELLAKERWNQQTHLADIIAAVLNNLEGFHASEVERLITYRQQGPEQQCNALGEDQQSMLQQNSLEKRVSKHRRKSSNMTGCADKELTQTKNLNRHFRSKLREVLRDLAHHSQYLNENYQAIDEIFTPNRVGFEDIRRALSNKWFNAAVRRQMNSGQFLHKILRGMMGIKSKKLMIKYYHVMVSAVEEPSSFNRWKYD